jgi:hypothetical protein
MKRIIAALIIGASIIYAAAELKPDSKADEDVRATKTCIINMNEKIIYEPCGE